MKILFMCVANSARSQLAEGLAKSIFGSEAEIESAGSKPTRVNPLAIEALKELEIDISKNTSKTVDDLSKAFVDHLDYVITLCAEEVCPVIISKAEKLYWPHPDPAGKTGTHEEQLKHFRETRDAIKSKLLDFKKHHSTLQPLDENVIETLVSNHAEFRKFLSKRLPSESVADDLLQQCLAKAVEKSDTLENNESAVAWFYKVLRNALIDFYRVRASEDKKYEAYLNELVTQGAVQAQPPDQLQAAICQCMNRLLPTLKTEYAELIRRIDLNGESPQAVAESLNLKTSNLTVRLHRARLALKTSLERSCGTCTEHGCLDCTCE